MDPVAYVTTPRWLGSLVITVGNFRSIDNATKAKDRWKIGMVPIKGNDCHAGIWGKITKGQSNALQRLSDWLVQIESVEKLQPPPS